MDPELSPSAVYLLLVRLEAQVKEGFKGVNERLDTRDDMANDHETRITVLEQRSGNPEVPSVRGSAVKWSTIGGGAIAAIIETVKALWPNAPGQ